MNGTKVFYFIRKCPICYKEFETLCSDTIYCCKCEAIEENERIETHMTGESYGRIPK